VKRLFPISTGIIEAVAKDFFNSEITMEIVNQIEELERTGKKEHVVFLVTQKPTFSNVMCSNKLSQTPPCLPRGPRRNAMHWNPNKEVKSGSGQQMTHKSLACILNGTLFS
jgi:hypothetical protein